MNLVKKKVIRKAWNYDNKGSSTYQLVNKLQKIQNKIWIWNREHFGHFQTKLRDLNLALEYFLSYEPSCDNRMHENYIKTNIDEELQC